MGRGRADCDGVAGSPPSPRRVDCTLAGHRRAGHGLMRARLCRFGGKSVPSSACGMVTSLPVARGWKPLPPRSGLCKHGLMDLDRLGSKELFRIGKAAFARGDRTLAEACLARLGSLHRVKAFTRERELRELLLRAGRETVPAKGTASRGREALLGDVMLKEIERRREEVIMSATWSLWLSSYLAPSARIVDLLIQMARKVRVVLLVDKKVLRGADYEAIDRLRCAGVDCRLPDYQHTKLIIVDEELIMNTSASLKGAWVDYGDVQEDRGKARRAIALLDGL
jgi:hypothetical protein